MAPTTTVTTVTNPDTGESEINIEPVSEAEDLRPFLLTLPEWGATALALGGGAFTLWAIYAKRPKWERWGGVAFALSGVLSAGATMWRHQQAKAALTR